MALSRIAEETIERARDDVDRDVVTRIVAWTEAQHLRPTETPDHATKGVGYQPVVSGLDWDPFPLGGYPKIGVVGVEIGHLQKRRPFNVRR